MHLAKTRNGAGEYTVLSLMQEGSSGRRASSSGPSSAFPGRSAAAGDRARLRVAPDLAQGSSAVSLAVDVAW